MVLLAAVKHDVEIKDMTHNNLFILENKTVIPFVANTNESMIEWAKWFRNADRSVKQTDITESVYVSTVFLGLDHGHGLSGEPLLFESMVFRNGSGDEMNRCSTWEEAETMHDEMVEYVKANLGR